MATPSGNCTSFRKVIIASLLVFYLVTLVGMTCSVIFSNYYSALCFAVVALGLNSRLEWVMLWVSTPTERKILIPLAGRFTGLADVNALTQKAFFKITETKNRLSQKRTKKID